MKPYLIDIKMYVFVLMLLLASNVVFSKGIELMTFRDFPIVQNLDSLEKAVNIQKKDPEKYLIGLLTLERSREMMRSYKFGDGLHLIDSLSKKLGAEKTKATYLYFLCVKMNVDGNKKLQCLKNMNEALDLFEQAKDTTGIISSLIMLQNLNIAVDGREVGSTKMAAYYLQRLSALADISSWKGDKIASLSAKQNYYSHFQAIYKDTLRAISKQALAFINDNPEFGYMKSTVLNKYANLFFFENNIEQSLALHLQCLDLVSESESYHEKMRFNLNVGNDYLRLENFKKAEIYYNEVIRLYGLAKIEKPLFMYASLNLAQAQYSLHQYKEGYLNLKTTYDLQVATFYEMQSKDFLELQTKYETDKKEQANLLLQKQKHQYQLGLLLGITLLAIISLLLFYLYRKNKQLDEYGHFRDQIFSIISHDLKSPVAALAGLSKKASYLIRQKETERLEKMSKSIDTSVMQITTLINNLLAWAISQDTTVATKMETFTLFTVVDEIIFLYQEVASTKMADIKIDIPENLTLYGNKNGMAVIIRNLIDNALKHISSTQIKVAASKKGNQVFFQITNNTFISSPEVVEKIQKQLKGINLNGINTSAGLGLRLVVYFAKQHNASIEMKSDDYEGTSFLVRLPQ